MQNKYIITTTINNPTEAIHKFDNMSDWKLIVVGDKKTPLNYNLKNGIYLSPEDQENYDKDLSDAIGWNCIQRRNFGLLKAHQLDADIIATIDDDNIPLDNWGKNLMVSKEIDLDYYETDEIVFDPISVTNYNNLWHRGFPLQLLSERKAKKIKKNICPDIQADFWNGDPDIDAICRMEHAPECKFDNSYFPFSSNKFSPFNSQNTFLSKTVLKDYFLFPHIGRMDDIWASYYVESLGFKVVYSGPSVYQDRNEHDLTIDFKKEVIGYENNLNLLKQLSLNPNNILSFIPERSKDAFRLYQKHFL
ncbi:hypothetical protein OA415_05925 [Pelagibacteraceae bacterium]|nr:hypothetical protein [Pelagibacteraceae bacterium]